MAPVCFISDLSLDNKIFLFTINLKRFDTQKWYCLKIVLTCGTFDISISIIYIEKSYKKIQYVKDIIGMSFSNTFLKSIDLISLIVFLINKHLSGDYFIDTFI